MLMIVIIFIVVLMLMLIIVIVAVFIRSLTSFLGGLPLPRFLSLGGRPPSLLMQLNNLCGDDDGDFNDNDNEFGVGKHINLNDFNENEFVRVSSASVWKHIKMV